MYRDEQAHTYNRLIDKSLIILQEKKDLLESNILAKFIIIFEII